MARKQTIQFYRGTAAQATSANPVLAAGEPGFETDTYKLKIGDGTTVWNSLPYAKIDESTFVHKTGDENVAGKKQFTDYTIFGISVNAGTGVRNNLGQTAVNGTAINFYYHTSGYGVIEAGNWGSSVSKIRINPAGGNVGIGKDPTQVLDVNGTAQATNFKYLTGTNGYLPISDANGLLTLQANTALNSRVATTTVGPSTTSADYVTPGTADQTQINSALNASANAKAFLRAGTYDIQGIVSPKSGSTIEGEGYGTLLQLGSGTGKTIKLDTLSNVTMRDFRIDATNVSSSNAFGMFIDKSDNIHIDHVWVLNANGFGIFLNTSTSTPHGKIRVTNSTLTGMGNADVLGGGPSDAAGVLGELVITGNYINQGVGANPGTYINAIDIVALSKSVISDNVTQGSILLGGEKIPHLNVNITNNIVQPSNNSTFGRIAVLTASNASETDDSVGINISNNQIISGHIYTQGQSPTSNRTRRVRINNNIIGGQKNNTETEYNWGIDLNYLEDVRVTNNTVDGSSRGIYLNNINNIDISNNSFLNCDTPIFIGSGGVTNMTGSNNIGINPDVQYDLGNKTGAVTIDRVNGNYQTITQTGNITVTLPSTFFKGETMTIDITPSTYTQTFPNNLITTNGPLSFLQRGSVIIKWDGTNWIEVSRTAAIIDGGTA